MKKYLTFIFAAAALFSVQAALLENGGFEELPEKKSDRTWRHYPAKGWEIYLANADSSFEIVENGAFEGKRAVRMISKSNKGMASVRNEKNIPAAAGDQIYVSGMLRGKGKCYIRIFWNDSNGKRQKKYFIAGIYADKNWKKFEVTAKVPAGAVSFVVSLEALNLPAAVEFDALDCNIVKAATIAAADAELPANGSFEVPADKISDRTWRHYPAKGWEGYAHPNTKSYCKTITGNVYEGSRAVRLICGDKKAIASLRSDVKPAVKPGDHIYVDTMIRGKGKAYIRIFWYDKNGKKLKAYFLDSRNATDKWQKFDTNVKVPAGVTNFELSLEIIASIGEIDFDAVKCRISSGTILDNGKIKAVLNPHIGGGIDSLTIAGNKMDFTQPNQIGNQGGMFNLILPSNRNPGELRFAPAKAEVLIPGRKIRMTQKIDSGKYAGIEAVRVFELLPGSNRITVLLQLKNSAKQPIETAFRMQSFASSSPGSFTWPTPDWIQIFHQTGEPLNGLNSIIVDLMRAGWVARFYKKPAATLLFSYNIKQVIRTYNYMVQDFVTNEWYYRPFTLKPGEVWKTEMALDILTGQKGAYIDQIAAANNHRLEEIKPVKMPPPPAGEPLPPIFQEFFPAGAGLPNLIQPETAGLEKKASFYEMYRIAAKRIINLFAESYVTSVGGVHMVIDDCHVQFYKHGNGKHELGEFLRQHRMGFSLSRMMYHRRDTDVNEYKKRLPEIIKTWKMPNLQKFVHSYADRMTMVNTGDEPLPANIEVVMAAQNELKKWMPKGIPIFTILNSHVVEMMPYMPVFYGDFYPVKRRSSSGANPWSVYREFADKVKKAGEKPVWFMPQFFAAGAHSTYDVYAYPTPGEVRMMANLALAAGVRGLCWYGFPNTGWQWVMKYFHLRYSPLNASGMPGPGWDAVVEVWKELSGTGMLLLRSRQAQLPANCSIKCGTYTDPYGLYDGPAAKLFALKSPKGMVIVAVSHNPNADEKITVTLPESGWDLTALKPLEGTTVTRTLKPGAAVFFYCGNDAEEIDLVHKGRYRAEGSRYLVAAKRAAGNGIAVIDPWKFEKLPGRAALAALYKEFDALNAKINAAPLGKALKKLNELQRYLGHNDFELTRNLEFFITKEMYDATGRYQRYVPDKDAAFQQLKEAVIDDFRDTNRITDYLNNGGAAAKILPELEALTSRAHRNMEALLKAVAQRRGNRQADDLRK